MEQMKFNDLNREFLEDFIAKLPKEDKEKLRQFVKDNPREKSSSMFTLVKSYIYNTYFKTTPGTEHRKTTFMETLDTLLEDNEDETF